MTGSYLSLLTARQQAASTPAAAAAIRLHPASAIRNGHYPAM